VHANQSPESNTFCVQSPWPILYGLFLSRFHRIPGALAASTTLCIVGVYIAPVQSTTASSILAEISSDYSKLVVMPTELGGVGERGGKRLRSGGTGSACSGSVLFFFPIF
jgi:hypothetical protein